MTESNGINSKNGTPKEYWETRAQNERKQANSLTFTGHIRTKLWVSVMRKMIMFIFFTFIVSSVFSETYGEMYSRIGRQMRVVIRYHELVYDGKWQDKFKTYEEYIYQVGLLSGLCNVQAVLMETVFDHVAYYWDREERNSYLNMIEKLRSEERSCDQWVRKMNDETFLERYNTGYWHSIRDYGSR
jgi:hypothetical protein